MLLVGDWAPANKRVKIGVFTNSVILGNLEGPILPPDHSFDPSLKAGPLLFSTQFPYESDLFLFSLANNHIMDYGIAGLEATLSLLDPKKFKVCGAGKNIAEARRPIVVECNGARIGIIACCEAQFGVARETQAGTAEFGPWVYEAIRNLREIVDAVIVSVHAGVEDSPWPSPFIRELYHSYIDAGATVVHGHHSHVPQGYEEYNGGLILYGMGNFAVDPEKWRGYPNGLWSLGAEIDFGASSLRWRVLTFELREETNTGLLIIEESGEEEKAKHQRYLELCNRPLAKPKLFTGLWQEVALRAYHHYGARYMRFAIPSLPAGRRVRIRKGLSMLKSALLNQTLPHPQPDQQDYLLWYHMVSCESHRQMLTTALGLLAGEIADLRTEETRQMADEMMPWSVGVVPT